MYWKDLSPKRREDEYQGKIKGSTPKKAKNDVINMEI
jgi:hypothetical protein